MIFAPGIGLKFIGHVACKPQFRTGLLSLRVKNPRFCSDLLSVETCNFVCRPVRQKQPFWGPSFAWYYFSVVRVIRCKYSRQATPRHLPTRSFNLHHQGQLRGLSIAFPVVIFGVVATVAGILMYWIPETLFSPMHQTIEETEAAEDDYGIPCCGNRPKKRREGITKENDPVKMDDLSWA